MRRGEIGVHAQTITPLMAEALGARPATPASCSRTSCLAVRRRSAGLQPGDVVLSLDGKRMENGRQFRINIYTRGDQRAR